MRTQIKKDKITDALELLNDAAQEKKEEVFELVGDKYDHLKDFFGNIASNGKEMAGQTKKQIAKSLHEEEMKLKEAAGQWNKKAHKAPWVFLGAAALGALFLGLTLGHKK